MRDWVERKFEFHETPRFRRAMNVVCVDEYTRQIIKDSIAYFCASLDKSIYDPLVSPTGTTFYEFEIPVMFRRFRIVFEVDGIDAYALDFTELKTARA